MKCLLVEIDHDDARLATIGIGNLGPVDDRQIRADRVLTEIIELGVAAGLRMSRERAGEGD
jgi:hypothetical protein